MQLQNIYKDRCWLLNEINTLNQSRELIGELKWQRYDDCGNMEDDGFDLLDRIWCYLYDLVNIHFMIYEVLTIGDAVDS